MIFQKTKIEGIYLITQEPRIDERGHFVRIFAKEELRKHGINFNIVHANRSLTMQKGMIRGLHYQKYPKQEDKLVQCVKGSIFDVALDLRKGSKTYGKWVGEVLSEENKKMLLVPKGFAHGFQALEKNCLVEYFVTQAYSPNYERGIRWNDPSVAINWPIKGAILSEKDQQWPIL
ncbi:dTDP-4-dehydrorhamnose 3,5-epimerase [Candidatus Roizmanbacteria bacterium]|nr:dTDP-4-dehydrorhamnose 3,5-epimerase [Candidatus Roizmanbacteria bacterium]